MVQRSVPVCGSDPIIASIMPKQAQVRPRNGVLPDSTATIEMPNTASERSSGEPTNRMKGRTTGSRAAITAAPNKPPIIADI
jgi:hypothetical protein